MAERWNQPHDSNHQANEQLESLEARQRELWSTLRSENDPALRMSLLSRFSENRTAIERLRESLGVEPDSGGGRHYRVEIVSGTDHADAADATDWSGAADSPDAIGWPDAADSPDAADATGWPDATDAVGWPEGPDHPEGADQPEMASSAKGPSLLPFGDGPGIPPPPSQATKPDRAPLSSATRKSVGSIVAELRAWPGRMILVGVTLVGLLGLAWLLTSLPSGDSANAGGSPDLATETIVAGPAADGRVDEINAVLQGLGATGVMVADEDGVLHILGTVDSEAQRQAVVGAVRALAGDQSVDDSALTVAGTVEEADTPAGQPTGRPAAFQAEIDRVIAATPIIFGVGEVALTDLQTRILNNVAAIMVAYQDIPVTIVGYTDDLGSDESNRELSLARAENVRAYLLSQGVSEAVLTIEPRGEATSSRSSALANLERRVEFEVAVPASVPAGADDGTLRIAVVAPSASNDLAFTQSMVDAVEVIAAERGGVEIAITDNTFVPAEAAAAIRGYAADGFDLVIAHGSQFGAALIEIAPDYPGVTFAWGTASDTFGLPNVYAYDAQAGQGGYVMGATGALLSRSGVIGVVGPIEVGDAQAYVNGFTAGAKSESPAANLRVAYTGSFSDVGLAAETTRGHLAAGADVMTGSAQMVVGAVTAASEAGALWFGTQSNQASMAPELVVASQVYHWEVILRPIVAAIDGGTVAGQVYSADLANGGLVIEYNPSYALPDPVRQRADAIAEAIKSGAVVVPNG